MPLTKREAKGGAGMHCAPVTGAQALTVTGARMFAVHLLLWYTIVAGEDNQAPGPVGLGEEPTVHSRRLS